MSALEQGSWQGEAIERPLAEEESQTVKDIRRQFAEELDNLTTQEYSPFGTLVLHGEKIPARGNKAIEDILIAIAKEKGITEEESVAALLDAILE